MRLWEIETRDHRTGASPTAPYRRYKKTDDEVKNDGYQRGLNWPDHWNHVPGGPYYHRISDHERSNSHPDWVEHVDTLIRHNKIWVDAWYEGAREKARQNGLHPELRKKISDN